MNTRKLLQEKLGPKVQKKVLISFDYISSFFKEFSIELLSIDYVQLRSFEEINKLGQLYLCKTKTPFFCMTDLDLRRNSFKKLQNEIIFERPIIYSIVSLSVIDRETNDNLILLIFPKNSKSKSMSELIELLDPIDKLN